MKPNSTELGDRGVKQAVLLTERQVLLALASDGVGLGYHIRVGNLGQVYLVKDNRQQAYETGDSKVDPLYVLQGA